MTKRGRLPSTRVSFNRCDDCSMYWKGIIRDENGKIERVIACNSPCCISRARIAI